jgi:hypothetical protein
MPFVLRKLLALAVALGAASLIVLGPRSQPAARLAWTCPRTAVLAALPSIGTVEWRSQYSSGRSRFSLGIHLFDTVSTGVRFRTGKFSRDRNLNAGDPTMWFRYSPSHVQWLAASWGDEAGFVAGILRADFSVAATRRVHSQDCWIFAPPKLTVRFYGHHRPFYGRPPSSPFAHGGLGGMLRPWPIR